MSENMQNRYVITREEINGKSCRIAALYDWKRRPVELWPEANGQETLSGNIYIARVDSIQRNLNAAFVKISPALTCYLSFEDVKHPIYTKKASKKEELCIGDELLVQVTRDAQKTKAPAVTTNLSFAGTYAVLTTGNLRHGVSAKLTKPQRAHYMALLEQETAYGVVIRTNAAAADDTAVLAEIRSLAKRCDRLLAADGHKSCFTLLYQNDPAYLKRLGDLRINELEEVVTDDPEVFEQLCEKFHIPPEQLTTSGSVPVPVHAVMTADGVRLRYYDDPMLSLPALYGLKSALSEALSTRVWLKSGAYLVIEPTEALTVVDVNTGKNMARKNAQENFLAVNKEAAAEIARQLRLRNISGIVIVDFINLENREAEDELLSVFRAALKKDPVPARLIGMTKLGLAEVTRKKTQKSLQEMLTGWEPRF